MPAIGKPLLAVYTPIDSAIRLFELDASDTSFEQTAVVSAPHVVSASDPYLTFNDVCNRLAIIRQSPATAAGVKMSMYDRQLIFIAEINRPSTESGRFKGFFHRATGYFGAINTDNTPNAAVFRNIDGFSSTTNTLPYYGVAAENAVAISPTGDHFFVGRSAGIHWVFRRVSTHTDGTPVFTAGTPITLNESVLTPSTAQFTDNGQFLVLGSKDSGYVEMFRLETDSATLASRTEEFGWVCTEVAIRFDNRIIAMGFQSGSSYKTVIYKRLGTFLDKAGEITGMGQSVKMTADGKYLLDPRQKKARQWDETAGTFSIDKNSVMSSLPTGITSSTLSFHVDSEIPRVQIFDAAVGAFTSRSIDLNNLKLMLVDETILFDKTYTDMTDFTDLATGEVYGAGWPQGGMQINNAAWQDITPSSPGLVGDSIQLDMINGSLTFRNAIVYDATSGQPLTFIQYQEDKQALESYRFTIAPLNGGYIRATK